LELSRIFNAEPSTPASRFFLVRAVDIGDRSPPDCQFGRQLASVKVVSSACFYGVRAARGKL
jgi:hypothetical protein